MKKIYNDFRSLFFDFHSVRPLVMVLEVLDLLVNGRHDDGTGNLGELMRVGWEPHHLKNKELSYAVR